MSRKQLALFEPTLVRQALKDAFKKLSPAVQWRNPVMFIVWAGSLLTTLLAITMALGLLNGSALFTGAISLWLWFTVLFANVAEAMAEGRSKAQASSLRGVKQTSFARRLRDARRDAQVERIPAADLRRDDIVLVEAGDIIPCDGEVIEGGASVDESAITGESAPVIRESGGAGQEQAIFDKFARGNKESAIPGVGLGLAICQAIVEVHGGTISAANRPQGGASFTIALPQEPAPVLDELSEDL